MVNVSRLKIPLSHITHVDMNADHDTANAVIVSLGHERFKKLIIEVDQPEQTMARLRSALPKIA